MKHYKWTINDDEWLKNNYGKLTPHECSEKIGIRISQLRNRIYKLGLTLPNNIRNELRSKSNKKCNINPDLFYNLNSPEIIYLLGLIWADGSLYQSKNKNVSNVGFTMVGEDLNNIRVIIDSIGKWNYYERTQPINTWKSSFNVTTNNKRIYDFLIKNDYGNKSHVSADKILSKIPNNLKHYWFRGLIDGDGCFYYYKPKSGSILRQFALASTYEQDWTYFEKLCVSLNIIYKIKRNKNDKSSSSYLRITNKSGVKSLGYYIYNDYENDNMGLERKYAKFKLIIK